MKHHFVEAVYDTLQGVLEKEACISGVDNLFEAGKPCSKLYEDMLASYERLRKRLDAGDEDSDVEQIINALLSISRHLGTEMFFCGVRFCSMFSDVQNTPRQDV